MYKNDASGKRLASPGSEFYDDKIPYDGVYPHYAKRIVEASSKFVIIMALNAIRQKRTKVMASNSFLSCP